MGALHGELLRKALVNPREPRLVPATARPSMLETVAMVLEQTGKPIRASEIYVAAEQLAGESLLRNSES